MRLALLLLVACSKSSPGTPLEQLRDRMCACKQIACGDAVEKELRALDVKEVTPEVGEQLTAIAACAATLAP